jgi:L-lactate permease
MRKLTEIQKSSIFVQSGIGILIKGLAHLPGSVTAFLTSWLTLYGTLTVGGRALTNFLFGLVAWNIFNSFAHNPALYTSVINMTGGGFAYSLSSSFIIGPIAIAGILGRKAEYGESLRA